MSGSEYARPTCSAWTKAREFTASLGSEIKCPACGTFGSTMNILKTCAGCGAPWRKAKRGGYEFLCRPNSPLYVSLTHSGANDGAQGAREGKGGE